jgi:hypothetical protein
MRVWFSMTMGTALLGLTILSAPIRSNAGAYSFCGDFHATENGKGLSRGVES